MASVPVPTANRVGGAGRRRANSRSKASTSGPRTNQPSSRTCATADNYLCSRSLLMLWPQIIELDFDCRQRFLQTKVTISISPCTPAMELLSTRIRRSTTRLNFWSSFTISFPPNTSSTTGTPYASFVR